MKQKSATETVLSVISPSADQRLVLAVRADHPKPILLRTESFSADIGWFTQQVLELTRQELNGLKSVLGVHVPSACKPAVMAAEARSEEAPQLLSFAAAKSKRA